MEGFVDMEDFSVFATDWQNPLQLEDLVLFAVNWLTIYTPAPSLAWWEMEETDGDVAYDSTVNAYDLVPASGFVISDATAPGWIDNGFRFDGSGERLTQPTLLDVMPDAITIAGWVKPDATGMGGQQAWFSKQNVGGAGDMLWLTFKMNVNVPNVIGSSGRSGGVFFNCNSSVTWEDDTWYHYAFTWDSSGCNIYVNGKWENGKETPIMNDGTHLDLCIGTGGVTSMPFKGTVDDVKIYSSVLSSAEIRSLYEASPGPATYDLIVNSGTGGGSYYEDTVVYITAGTPPEGYVFDVWTGDTAYVANINDPTTTVTMPAAVVTVTATYKDQGTPHTLTVNNGTGDGSYFESTVVDIAAITAPVGQVFDVWTGDTEYVADIYDPTTTVNMPASEVTVTATFKAAPRYTLTVNSGTGDGDYFENIVVSVAAATPPVGFVFDAWTGDIAYVTNINNPTTTVTMPADDITITATYKDPGTPYTLTVNSGTGDGSYFESTVVDIAANTAPAGKVFDAWTGDTAYVANIIDQTTTVTMPAQNVIVTATYEPTPPDMAVSIGTDFAGGNVLVNSNTGSTIHLEPDLRGGGDWFYWYFEATANRPGQVDFVFPTDIGGVGGGPAISRKGPAISYDDGETWDWLGDATVDADSFTYDFTADQLTVRFAVTMPYLQSNLDAFLADNASNPHLTRSVLTQSLKGRDVELLQIGQPGTGRKAVLFTARHHACETMASYVLEGVLKDAISDTTEAVAFRNSYVLYVVPFVDKDGVEEGDQGKNRSPHDHNRDYGANSLFPEVDAIEALGVSKNIQFVMDYHCPTLRMPDHQVFYFAGPDNAPVYNDLNVSAFAALIDSELPSSAPAGPYNWMNDTDNPTMCARYFGIQPGMIMSTTLEVPYAPPGKGMDAASGLLYGAAILRAWMGMTFQSSTEYSLTVNNGSGGGSYIDGLVVDITADAPPVGQVFDAWTGDTATISNTYDPTTTITMSAAAAAVTATYREPGTLYTLTVNAGTGEGSYWENAVVDIVADAPLEGEEFVAWTGDTAYLADADEPTTSITMPAQDVTLTATYQIATVHMLAWWEMEETTGTASSDSSGNENYLVPTGGLTISGATTTGKFGNGFAFDGSGKRFTHPTLLEELPDAITIMGWLRPMPGNTGAAGWLNKQNTNTSAGADIAQLYLQVVGGSDFRVVWRSGSTAMNTLRSYVTYEENTWYHYAMTWDADGMALYIDGDLKGTDPAPIMGDGVGMPGNIDLSIGTGNYHLSPFTGMIDDVRIYDGVLTAQEIADLYNWTGGTTYALAVNSGSGDGSYAQGAVVNITADGPPP